MLTTDFLYRQNEAVVGLLFFLVMVAASVAAVWLGRCHCDGEGAALSDGVVGVVRTPAPTEWWWQCNHAASCVL